MDELKSRSSSSEPCLLRFRNDRAAAVLLWWLDHEGKAVSYGSLPAGTSVDQSTYTGHAWRLCDETTGVPLAEYVGASATVTLRADGSVRVASTEAAALEDAAGPSGKAPEFELDLEDQEGSGEEEQGSDDEKSSGEGVLPQSATAP
ncbi:hypothetical protein D9Q98_004407 [Chlorella vulgaris]|uniref:von Hippel-Lindau disease tumour suppressor beta domain-containing protein n=1 Tax=Chlorella vulgaris TaxID=3077 RepID=A0A9D4TQX6_CHLVU|nr:hypothetical protein D9Q98_004407 [Chlorella vulgaris]